MKLKHYAMVAVLAATLGLGGCESIQQLFNPSGATAAQLHSLGEKAIFANRTAIKLAYLAVESLSDAEKLSAERGQAVIRQLATAEGYVDSAEKALDAGLSIAPDLEAAAKELAGVNDTLNAKVK